MQPFGAGEIEKGLVDRQRLDQRREREHRLAHLAAGFDVFRHVRPDHHRVRAAAQRLEHRHGGADAIGARHVAAGGDHAALAAADDHRLVDQRGIVAFLDRGVEGVAVDMRDGERIELGDGARGAASRMAGSAPPCPARSARQSRQKLTGFPAPRARRRARCGPWPISAGSQPASAANAAASRSSETRYSSTPARKPRLAAGGANLGRADAGHGQEAPEPLGIPGNEGKRLNRKPFCRFRRHRHGASFIGQICLSVTNRHYRGRSCPTARGLATPHAPGRGALGTNGAGKCRRPS